MSGLDERRVLVTGATGFLGRHAVEALRGRGFTVVAAGGGKSPGADLRCDLLDDHSMHAAVAAAGAGRLLHLAWADDARDRMTTPANLDWTAASLRLARAFADHGGKHVVFGGSCAQYNWSHGLMREHETPIAPRSLYGAAKAATESLLFAGAGALGVKAASARIFFCYGPGEPAGRLTSDLLAGLSAGRRIPCTDGRQERDYLHAADVGAALALIVASDCEGPVNVGSGEATAVGKLIAAIAERMGRPDLPDFGAIARRPDDPARFIADVSILRALGFAPRHTLLSGVDDLVRAHQGAAA